MSDNVKVAVRVRPFNQREKDNQAKLVIRMDGPTTYITNPNTGEEKHFAFDFSYWSFDTDDTHFASQTTVFNDLGVLFVSNALQGFNCSIFAYGQTGSGKSYSMVGYGKDKGIIPLGCEELFERLAQESEKGDDVTFKVAVSFLEIYNENIRDLFGKDALKEKGKKKGGLKIRESKEKGIYVDGVNQLPVANYADVENAMEMGTRARTIAATNMNNTSSRGHSVFTVFFTATKVDRERMTANDKTSKVNLVDLAGSERQASTGATGDRLKEGCAINKSLSALGNVISALAEPKKGQVIPYRDSVLTRLLQESLGGNAKTIMIAALSPASINYEETLNTLRYANRAKMIKNKPTVNENPNEKLIRQLREEVNKLKAQLVKAGLMSVEDAKLNKEDLESPEVAEMIAAAPNGGVGPAAVSTVGMTEEEKELAKQREEENRRLQEELASAKSFMDLQKQKWEEELAQAREEQAKKAEEMGSLVVEKDDVTPYFVNLSEDPQMNETLCYPVAGETHFVSEKPSAEEAEEGVKFVTLRGLNIGKPKHCILENEDGTVSLHPIDGHTFVNGRKVTESVELKDNDRVVLGNNHFFRYNDPVARKDWEEGREAHLRQFPEDESLPEWQIKNIDYAFAQEEQFAAQMGALNVGASKMKSLIDEDPHLIEMRLEVRKAVDLFEREKAEKVRILNKMTRDLDRTQQQAKKDPENEDLQEKISELDEDLHEMKNEYDDFVVDQERAIRSKEEDVSEYVARKEYEAQQVHELEVRLAETIPMIGECNEISRLMGKNLEFEIKLITNMSAVTKEKETEIAIIQKRLKEGIETFWSYDKFMNRIFLIREAYEEFVEDPDEFVAELEEDPFWDPPEDQMVGQAQVFLEGLSYGVEIELTTPIVDYSGHQQGELVVEVRPCDENGEPDNIDDETWGEPDTRMDFLVRIIAARGLPSKNTYGTFCQYKFFAMEEPFLTERCEKRSINPVWNYERQFTVMPVTDDFMEHLKKDALVVEVWGHSKEAEELEEQAQQDGFRSATPSGVDRMDPSFKSGGGRGRARSSSISMGMPIRAHSPSVSGPPGLPPQSPKDSEDSGPPAEVDKDTAEQLYQMEADAAMEEYLRYQKEKEEEAAKKPRPEDLSPMEAALLAAKAHEEKMAQEGGEEQGGDIGEEEPGVDSEEEERARQAQEEEEERLRREKEEEEKQKLEEALKAKEEMQAELAKAKEEALANARAELEAQAKLDAESRVNKEEEETQKREKELAEMKAKIEAEARAQIEAERAAIRAEAEERRKKEEEDKRKAEEEKKRKEEEDRLKAKERELLEKEAELKAMQLKHSELEKLRESEMANLTPRTKAHVEKQEKSKACLLL